MTTKRKISVGPGVSVDLDRLIGTRLLIQANSGGGKSWALRRLLEQTHGKVQQIVIDPEGEFATLREKFDYVLAARQGGDTLADPRTAKLLAERLLEMGVSAVLDLYELPLKDRVLFVKLFLEALVDAKKELWHPVLVVVDEAHIFAPEEGDAESYDAVTGLCSRGRKRGFCAVLATQRLSKLAKDAAAECNNKLIGRTSLDVDMKRAGDELGFPKSDRLQLRDLEDGQFFAFGPALSKVVTKVTVGPVQTTHPKAGSKLAAVVPPPTDKVKAVLSKLADLPAEAEAREKTVADLKKEIVTLKRAVTEAKKAMPPAPKTDAAKNEKIAELKELIARQRRALDEAMKILVKVKAVDFSARGGAALEEAVTAAVKQVTSTIEKRINALAERIAGIQAAALVTETAIAKLLDEKIDLSVTVQKAAPFTTTIAGRRDDRPSRASHPAGRSASSTAGSPNEHRGRSASAAAGTGDPVDGLSPAEQRVLDAVGWWRPIFESPSRHQVAFVAGYTVNGHFNNLVGGLRTKGLIDYPQQGGVRLTSDGQKLAVVSDDVPTRELLAEKVLAVLEPSPGKIFRAVYDAGRDLTRGELAELTNYTVNGHFNNMVGSLRSLGVIDYPSRGGVTLGAMFEALP